MTLTRLVRTMSSMHSTTMSLRTGATPTELAFSKQHFPKFLAATMAASGLTGYFAMEYIQQKQFEVRCVLSLVDDDVVLKIASLLREAFPGQKAP